MAGRTCSADHRYYVADVVGVENEGKVFVLIICTACGDFISHETTVSATKQPFRLLSLEKEKNVS